MSTEYDETTTTINLSPTTTESPLTTMATFLFDDFEGNPTLHSNSYQREHLEHNKITFEIPNHHDLEHIDSMHNFNTLLKRIGNVITSSDASQFTGNNHEHKNIHHQHHHNNYNHNQEEHLLTNAEISKSVVLDLADLKGNNDGNFGFERFFAGADMHSIINYLWIGVVTSLIVLSIIFIVFSCYFYRKFREWKKCNKDIRAHLNGNNDNSTEILYAHGTTARTYFSSGSTAYYQMESPPCYTIATGLPSYDEALLHHYHHQQRHHNYNQQNNNYDHDHDHEHNHSHEKQKCHNHFNYALKYMYSTPAAVHQQQRHQHQHQHQQHEHENEEQQHQQQQVNFIVQQVNEYGINTSDEHFIRNWKKMPDSTVSTITATTDADDKLLQYCSNANNVDHKNVKITNNKKQAHQQQQRIKVSTLLMEHSPPPAYDVTARMALLSGIDVESTQPIFFNNKKIDKMNISIPDEILINSKKIDIEKNQEESNNECFNVATSSTPSSLSSSSSSSSSSPASIVKTSIATIFSQTPKAEIDESLNNIVVA